MLYLLVVEFSCFVLPLPTIIVYQCTSGPTLIEDNISNNLQFETIMLEELSDVYILSFVSFKLA